MKSRCGKNQRREEKKKEDQGRKGQKTEDAGARKGSKVAKYFVFSMICGSGVQPPFSPSVDSLCSSPFSVSYF